MGGWQFISLLGGFLRVYTCSGVTGGRGHTCSGVTGGRGHTCSGVAMVGVATHVVV